MLGPTYFDGRVRHHSWWEGVTAGHQGPGLCEVGRASADRSHAQAFSRRSGDVLLHGDHLSLLVLRVVKAVPQRQRRRLSTSASVYCPGGHPASNGE